MDEKDEWEMDIAHIELDFVTDNNIPAHKYGIDNELNPATVLAYSPYRPKRKVISIGEAEHTNLVWYVYEDGSALEVSREENQYYPLRHFEVPNVLIE